MPTRSVHVLGKFERFCVQALFAFAALILQSLLFEAGARSGPWVGKDWFSAILFSVLFWVMLTAWWYGGGGFQAGHKAPWRTFKRRSLMGFSGGFTFLLGTYTATFGPSPITVMLGIIAFALLGLGFYQGPVGGWEEWPLFSRAR